MLTRRRSTLIITALVAVSVLSMFQHISHPSAFDILDYLIPPTEYPRLRHPTLGVFSNIYVISIPQRIDRRADMEHLRRTLQLNWTYIDATDRTSPDIANIRSHVRAQRIRREGSSNFSWPTDINDLTGSNDLISSAGADFWDKPSSSVPASLIDKHANTPLTCAERDDIIPPYTEDLPPRKILNSGKIACWHSHLQVIRQIAYQVTEGPHAKPSLILEDDIDMEMDIQDRLAAVWGALPESWDMLYLGHCWSDQRHFAAITSASLTNASSMSIHARSPGTSIDSLHPAYKPKCSHAYALTPSGARKLWMHLRYPPFAYSRAIDQAFAWLIESGRVKSFSIEPAVVVQRKVTASDVMDGLGSAWRETLDNGIF